MNTSWFFETYNEDNTQQNYPQSVSIAILFFSFFFIIAGTIGNTLTVIVFIKCKKLRRQPTTIFIMNLTIAELMISTISLPLFSLDFSKNDMTNDFLCKLAAVLYYGNMSVSLFSLVAIAINRYILIVKSNIHNNIYTPRNILIIIMSIWMLSYSLLLPMIFGVWGSVGLDKKVMLCEILKNNDDFVHPKKILIPSEFFLSCIIVCFSYYCIYQKIQESRKKISSYSTTTTAAVSNKKNNQETEISFLMFKIFIGFFACFLPTVLVNIFDSEGKYPVYHLVESMTSCASVVINPIIYVSTNKLYRNAYKEVFSWSSNDNNSSTQYHNNTLNRQPQFSSTHPTSSSMDNDSAPSSSCPRGGG